MCCILSNSIQEAGKNISLFRWRFGDPSAQEVRNLNLQTEINVNKKVPLRECKKHTTHHVASRRCAGLVGVGGFPCRGYPFPGGVPPLPGKGGPPIQTWEGGTPHQLDGVPPSRPGKWLPPHPPISWMGYPPVQTWEGYPPISWMGYPPWM